MRVVRVRALKTFDNYIEGNVYVMNMSERVAELIVLHYFLIV